ncbi:MAG: hypothetical protein KGI69_02850 [Patescibacteria group bacterium]|nr:hypothetical protein [Patescibacteria group bacterium]
MNQRDYDNARNIKVVIDGKEFVGRYIVKGQTIKVSSSYGEKATQIGGSKPEMIAEHLLTEIISKNHN